VAQTCGSLHVCDRTDAWLTVMRPRRRVAQTRRSLHVCDRTDAWLTVMRPQRDGKHNSQTSQNEACAARLSVHRTRNTGWGLRRHQVKVDLSWLSTFEVCKIVFKGYESILHNVQTRCELQNLDAYL